MKPWRKCKHSDGTYCLISVKPEHYCKGHSTTCGSYEPLIPQGHRHHNGLKEKAKQQLLALGFKDEEIRMEYQVTVPVTLRVDVVAFRAGSSVAVECGELRDLDRVNILRRHFDKVLIIQ